MPSESYSSLEKDSKPRTNADTSLFSTDSLCSQQKQTIRPPKKQIIIATKEFVTPLLHGQHVLELLPSSQHYHEEGNKLAEIKYKKAPQFSFGRGLRS